MVTHLRNLTELKMRLKPYYIIRDFMSSKENFIDFQESMYEIICGCYEHKKLRQYPIKFKFYDTDVEFQTLPLHHFIIHLFYWYPFTNLTKYRDVMTDEYIMRDMAKDIVDIDLWINKLIHLLSDYGIKQTVSNYDISYTLKNLRRINTDFSLILGLNFDMFTIMDMYNTIPEFREIMELELSDDLQPAEIEQIFKEKLQELMTLLKSIPNNPIGIILNSGTGIKDKQLGEFLIFQGLKPTIEGATIPLPIKNSTVLGGLNKASDVFIDGTAARKSMIMSHKTMGTAGHFAKVLTELSRTISLSKEVSDCGTTHLTEYIVKTPKHLRYYNGKYYTLDRKDHHSLKLLNGRKDTHLIGKTIYVRSVADCALDGDMCCAKCMGKLANLNFDIANGVGAFLTKETTKTVEQNILSTKHVLTTISEMIIFNPRFYDFFSISGDEIIPNFDNDTLDISEWVIETIPDTVVRVDDMDADEGYNTFIEGGKFIVRNVNTGEFIEMEESKGKPLFLTDDIVSTLTSKGEIAFKDLSEDVSLFIIQITNHELTKPLYDLMQLVTKAVKTEDGSPVTIDMMAQRFIDIYVEAGIQSSAVSAEIIINRLTRSINNIYQRPSFRTIFRPDYQIVTLSVALEKHPSVLVGLSYQFLQRQLTKDDTFDIKESESYLDPFYQEYVSTAKWKEDVRKRKLGLLDED